MRSKHGSAHATTAAMAASIVDLVSATAACKQLIPTIAERVDFINGWSPGCKCKFSYRLASAAATTATAAVAAAAAAAADLLPTIMHTRNVRERTT